MRVAALYDIHGNLPAFDAVMEDVRRAGVDQIVIGGDVVPGPMPVETIARLRSIERPVHFIRGNCEREVVASMGPPLPGGASEQHRRVLRWVLQQLSQEDRDFLAGWPSTLRMSIDRVGEVLFCHATPRNDVDVFTERTAEHRLLPVFGDAAADVVVCGHTHMQFDRKIGMTHVINAGSVGMPFGEPGAYWALIGPDVELRRTTYDLHAAADLIARTSYPLAQEFASRYVLQPPSAQEMLEIFSRGELK